MKKFSVIVACMAVAVMSSCGGSGLKKVTMNDVKDTISYSIGMGRAIRVYKEQLPENLIDSLNLKSFMKGFLEAAANPENNDKLSYVLGYEIGQQEMSQAFIGLGTQLFGEGGSFNRSNYITGFRDGMLDNFDVMSFEEADEMAERLYDELSSADKENVTDEPASEGKVGTVVLNTVKDSISYAIGMGRAIRVYKETLPEDIVTSSTMKKFVNGFLEAASVENDSKLAYAIGFEVGCQELSQAFISLSETLFGPGETFNRNNYLNGFVDGMTDNYKIMSYEEADATSNRLYQELSEHVYDKIRLEGEEFLEKKAREEDVVKTESGLLYEILKHGDGGPKPTANSDVEVRYRGELIDGTMFDESREPITLNLGGVIAGWTEGLQLMSVGDKYRFYLPYYLGYGERGAGGTIKPYSTLVFEVELVNIK